MIRSEELSRKKRIYYYTYLALGELLKYWFKSSQMVKVTVFSNLIENILV